MGSLLRSRSRSFSWLKVLTKKRKRHSTCLKGMKTRSLTCHMRDQGWKKSWWKLMLVLRDWPLTMLHLRIDSIVRLLCWRTRSFSWKRICNLTRLTLCGKWIRMISLLRNCHDRWRGSGSRTSKCFHSWMRIHFSAESSGTWNSYSSRALRRWKGARRSLSGLAGRRIFLLPGWDN